MLKKIRKSLTLKWMVFSILLATIPLTIAGVQYYSNLSERFEEVSDWN